MVGLIVAFVPYHTPKDMWGGRDVDLGADQVALLSAADEPLQGHRTPGGAADGPLQLVLAVGSNRRVSMQGKALHAGNAGAAQGRALTFEAKARLKATDVLTRSFVKGKAGAAPTRPA